VQQYGHSDSLVIARFSSVSLEKLHGHVAAGFLYQNGINTIRDKLEQSFVK